MLTAMVPSYLDKKVVLKNLALLVSYLRLSYFFPLQLKIQNEI